MYYTGKKVSQKDPCGRSGEHATVHGKLSRVVRALDLRRRFGTSSNRENAGRARPNRARRTRTALARHSPQPRDPEDRTVDLAQGTGQSHAPQRGAGGIEESQRGRRGLFVGSVIGVLPSNAMPVKLN